VCYCFLHHLSKTSKEIEDKGIYLLGDILLELLFLEKNKNGYSSFDKVAHINDDLYFVLFEHHSRIIILFRKRFEET
jgi:hypothetical protein